MSNEFYRDHYNKMVVTLLIAILIALGMVILLLYQVYHRPLPKFFAMADNQQQMVLMPFDTPNLTSKTLIKWASKAAVAAYTFDFVNYDRQLALAKPYFTDAGWTAFQESTSPLIDSIKANQLFISGVISGPPVISNQGDLPGRGYVWRLQMPFLVTYQSADSATQKTFTVIVSIVKVPTWKNSAGIGIDQFLM